ncbi:MAG: sulfite exporter TauE/SafE family protein [Oscillospiraceae bacterium]|nr:sulfite exporter TauE/SafE family protein [Oscillospiraceae bacterium]
MDLFRGLLLVVIGIGAGFVQRVSGFGLGIFAMMFLPHFMPSHTDAATISTLFSCITSTYNSVRYRRNVEFKTAFPMICAALISIPVAVYFSAAVSGEIFKILLGAVLIVLSIYFMFFNKHIKINPTCFNGILAGTLGGTLNGLFSTGGPPVVLYLSNAMTDNITYFATIQFYFCFTNLYATAMRALNGIINIEILIYAAIGVVGCMIGDFIGKSVFEKLNSNKLKYIIYIGMIISGIVMFF